MRRAYKYEFASGAPALRRLAARGLLAVSIALPFGAQPSLAQFVDVTPDNLARESQRGRGAAWIDYNTDGRQDLYVTSWSRANGLFRNEGGGVFTDVTVPEADPPSPADLTGDGWVTALDLATLLSQWGSSDTDADYDGDGIVDAFDLATLLSFWMTPPVNAVLRVGDSLSGRSVWADIDNDGDLEVYLCQGEESALLRRTTGSAYENITNGEPLEMTNRLVRSAAFGDYDGDGLVDLYISCHQGGGANDDNRLLRNLGGGAFEDVTPTLMADIGVGRGVTWVDYNNDGHLDLYLVNGNPGVDGAPAHSVTNRLFRNNGDGTFSDVTTAPLDDPQNGRACAWGDYDNDGDFDLYIANLKVDGVGGSNRLLRNDGGGVFTDVTTASLGTDLQTRDAAFIDYDNDGDLDLFIVNAFAPNLLFRNDNGNFVQVNAGALALGFEDGRAAAWGDYDLDGSLDAYITTFDRNYLIRNDHGSSNNWIQIRLEGTTSNRSAIGAQIRVTTGELTQLRQIESGSGYMTMHQLPAHFGLGDAELIDQIEIRWPSGIVQTLSDIAVDQVLDVTEPAP